MLLSRILGTISYMESQAQWAGDIRKAKRATKRTLLWVLLAEVISVIELVPVMFFVNEITSDQPSADRLLAITLSFAALYKIGQLLRTRLSMWRNRVFWRSWKTWWRAGFESLLKQSTAWHIENGTGEKESLVGKNISKFEDLFDQVLFVTIPVTFRIALTSVFLFFIHWGFGLFAVFVSLAYIPVMLWSERRNAVHREDFQKHMKTCETFGSELNQNWQTIRMLGLEEEFAQENNQILEGFVEAEEPRHKKYVFNVNRQDDVVIVCRMLMYGLAGFLVIEGQSVSTGAIILATSWLEKSLSNYGRYAEFQNSLNKGRQAIIELAEFIPLVPTVRSPDVPTKPETTNGDIFLRDVSFSYEESGAQKTICGINLHIPAHTSVALVGGSGGGKSTLIKLLGREFDPCKGSVEVDGVDIRDYDYKSYRNQTMAVVSQNISLFNRSVLDNIRVGRKTATREEVIRAAQHAEAHEFIELLPCGYDTQIGENGLKLSGGQRQRLAIARALLMQCPILVLDEATSALDAVSQAGVQDTLQRLNNERICTIVIVAHRLSTVRIADKVVVMHRGQVNGEGTHEELLEQNEIYQELCRLELE